MKSMVLVIDDEQNICRSLSLSLRGEGYKVLTSTTGKDGLEIAKRHDPDLVLLDIQLPDIDGLCVLERLKKENPALCVIMISGHGTIETAVKATKLGAFDFIEKPLSLDKILLVVRNALQFKMLQEENITLREELKEEYELIGESPPMKRLQKEIERVAPTDARVLITGENGTGKELVARAIHSLSKRSESPFVKVNCAAIPDDLIESELFGYERGAFTGATRSKKGRFELADKGTLFLDEVGDMSLKTQAKVLRVLQESEFERVGGLETIKVDVRVIAATNKDLEAEIKQGNFRDDLYFRLNVVPILVSPLRDRKGDVAILARRFLTLFCRSHGRRSKVFDQSAIQALEEYYWPGNVRELKNIVERIVILSDRDTISRDDILNALPSAQKKGNKVGKSLREAVREYERDLILDTLARCGHNITDASKILEIERSHLYKKMRQYGIR